MSQCTDLGASQFDEEPLLVPTTIIPRATERGVYETVREPDLRLNYLEGIESTISIRGSPLLEKYSRIECYGFPQDKPWLPPQVLRLLDKAKTGSITERELLKLMGSVAERASVHFQLHEGRFVAMTFHGRIVEVSDTRVGLLKKIQSRKQEESIFVWKIGSTAFSGRL
jgi:hypothetical protein